MTAKDKKDIEKMITKAVKESKHETCPSCGHCPTCGRSNGVWTAPYRPWYPYQYPYWYSSGTLTISGNSIASSSTATGTSASWTDNGVTTVTMT